jgi:hypothetical protein
MVGNSVEHFPPKSVTHKGFLLPCCRECNAYAGTSYAFDFDSRINFVREKIEKKNAKYLKMPIWTEEDLEELSGKLRRSVKLCQEKRRIARKRLAWDVYKYLVFLGRESCSAATFAEHGITISSEKLLTNSM